MSQTPVSAEEYNNRNAPHLLGFRTIHEAIDRGVPWSGSERNAAFLNMGAAKGGVPHFADWSSVIGFDYDDDARALGVIDWNFDGALDMFVTNRTGPRLRFLKNTLPSGDRFLMLKLVGTLSNRDAVGARATVTLATPAGPVKLMRTVYAGHGFISQSSQWLHFGLDAGATIERVVVRWPDGKEETIKGCLPGGYFAVTQGNADAQRFIPPATTVPLAAAANTEGETGETAAITLLDPVPLPLLNYIDARGNPARIAGALERPLLINLWAPWCAPCIAELKEFTAQRGSLQKVDILALNVDLLKKDDAETLEKGRVALNQIGYPFASGQPTKELMSALELAHNSTFLRPNQLPVPCSFLLNRAGRIVAVYRGRVSVERLLHDVTALESTAPDAWVRHATPFAGQWLKPREKVPYLHMVTTLLGQGAVTAAAEFLTTHEEVLSAEPLYAKTLMVVGTGLLQKEQPDQGMRLLRRALALDPTLAEAHNNLGSALRATGDRDEAQKHISEALKLKPDYIDALINMANLESDAKRYPQALKHIDAALVVKPDHESALWQAGALHIHLQNWFRAKAPFEQLLKKHPENVDILINLGGVHAKLGEFVEAARYYEKALKLAPDRPGVQEALDVVRRQLPAGTK